MTLGGMRRNRGRAETTTTNGEMSVGFSPGADGHVSWNSTVAHEGQPLLVYFYRVDAPAEQDLALSKTLEHEVLTSKRVQRLAEQFLCEKIALSDQDLNAPTAAPRPIEDLIDEQTGLRPGQRQAMLIVLDPSGQELHRFTEAPHERELIAVMRKATRRSR